MWAKKEPTENQRVLKFSSLLSDSESNRRQPNEEETDATHGAVPHESTELVGWVAALLADESTEDRFRYSTDCPCQS